MSQTDYEKRHVAFVDILGFRSLVSEKARFFPAARALAKLHSHMTRSSLPGRRDLSWNGFWMSDSIVVTAEPTARGLRNLLGVIHPLYVDLIRHGEDPEIESVERILLRGAVVTGDVFDQPPFIFGPALVRAVELEKLAIYPRVIIDRSVSDCVRLDSLGTGDVRASCFHFSEDSDGWLYLDSLRTQPTWGATPDEWIRCFLKVGEDAVRMHAEDPKLRMKYAWMVTKAQELMATSRPSTSSSSSRGRGSRPGSPCPPPTSSRASGPSSS